MSEISWFYERLNEVVKSKNIPVKDIAESVDVNYARFLQVMKGRKRIKLKELSKVLDSNFFTEYERKELLDLHQYTDVDEEIRNQVLFFESVLIGLYETVIEKESLPTLISKRHESTEAVTKTCELLNDHIFLSYANKARMYMLKKTDETFKIDFYLPTVEPILHEVFHTLNALLKCIDKHLKLDLCIYIYIPEANSKDFDQAILNLVRYFKLATLDAPIQVRGLRELYKGQENYDYFVCLEDRRVWMNHDGSKSFVVHGNQNKAYIDQQKIETLSFTEKMETHELNNYLYESTLKKEYHKSKMRNLRYCFNSMVFDEELFKQALSERICKTAKSFKQADLINAYGVRITSMEKRLQQGGDVVQYLCGRGIEIFIKDGILNDYAEFVGAFSRYERLKVLINTIELIKNGPNIKVILPEVSIKYKMLNVLRFFEIHLDLNVLMIIKHFRFKELRLPEENHYEIDGRTVKHALKFTHPKLIEAWQWYTDVFLNSIASDQEASIHYLEKLIDEHFSGDEEPLVQKTLLDYNLQKKMNALKIENEEIS
ncbi:MAG: hypothetical protein JXR88_03385 [Clostridia bacterium]|nr:hypothetical protein [Clostridia bacterium]